MKTLILSLLLVSASAFSFNRFYMPSDYPATVEDATQGWPSVTAQAVDKLIENFGQPDAISSNMLIWENTGPFKRTILHREPIQHNFPKEHQDFIEQVIDYKVSLEKYDEIAKFDGSVLLDRTAGEMAARCDMIEANYLALNLAHKVATGELDVQKAREEFVNAVRMHMDGNTPQSMQQLQFEIAEGETADPDESMMD